MGRSHLNNQKRSIAGAGAGSGTGFLNDFKSNLSKATGIPHGWTGMKSVGEARALLTDEEIFTLINFCLLWHTSQLIAKIPHKNGRAYLQIRCERNRSSGVTSLTDVGLSCYCRPDFALTLHSFSLLKSMIQVHVEYVSRTKLAFCLLFLCCYSVRKKNSMTRRSNIEDVTRPGMNPSNSTAIKDE